jgi:hypothetical protein
MSESAKRTGPHVVGGHLFFLLADGSTIDCRCIGEPYGSRIVSTWEAAIKRAREDGRDDF